MGAIALSYPDFAITAKEARMLADAVIAVAKQYAVEINPKLVAWMQLGGALCAVYGTKAFTLWLQSQAGKPAPARRADNVVDIRAPVQQQTAPPANNPTGAAITPSGPIINFGNDVVG